MRKLRRKISIPNTDQYRIITLYECLAKWGTQNIALTYLFDEPEIDIQTTAIKYQHSQGNNAKLLYEHQYSVRVYDVRDSIVFLEMF